MAAAEPQLRNATYTAAQSQKNSGNYEFIRELLTTLLHSGQIEVPVLPEVAARVVKLATSLDVDSQRLFKLIIADPALASHVMRVASSAAYMPNSPLTSLQQAITWLGLGEVANITFTVAVQGKLLDVPGQRSEVLAMWREAVCAGIWARELAGAANVAGGSMDAGALYLCGLLHEIGRPVVLQAVADVCQRTRTLLTSRERAQLMNEFKRPVGARIVRDWKLPQAVAVTVGYWNDPAMAPAHRHESTLVGLAHRMAECSLNDDSDLARNAIATDEHAGELGISPDGMRTLLNRTERVLAQVRTH